jgi:transcriptional regulator with XRE-family HTH domain
MEEAFASTGTNIRAIRQARGLTIANVSDITGLSPGYISQVERDKVNPSIATMRSIADALGVAIGALFSDQIAGNSEKSPRIVVRSSEASVAAFSNENIQIRVLSSSRGRRVVMTKIVAVPGAESGDSVAHGGEECATVIRGTMEIWLDEEYYVLHEGDTIYVDSGVRHKWRAAKDSQLEVIWVASPPNY